LFLGFDRPGVLEDGRMPLVGIPAQETIEILEAQARRPQVEWAGLARHPVGHVVHLAEPGRVVAAQLEDFADRARAPGHQRVVSRVPGRELGDVAAGDAVMVAPGDERGAGRRAERRGVELVEAQAAVGDALETGRRHRAAEGAAGAEANVIGQDQQDVWRPFGRLDTLREVGSRSLDGASYLALERRLWAR